MTVCPNCGAVLGPEEDQGGCLSCTARLTDVGDHLIAVLERSPNPLPAWDIGRLARPSLGWTAHEGLVRNYLRPDWRACWGGRGRYGLVRHGLFPYVRDLGVAAGLLVHVSDGVLTTNQIDFALRQAGYRFGKSSLYPALGRVIDRGMIVGTWDGWRGKRSMTHQRSAVIDAIGVRRGELDVMLDHVERQLTLSLEEARRRHAMS